MGRMMKILRWMLLWWLQCLIFGLLAFMVFQNAWRYRPLDTTDAKLIGTWSRDADPNYQLRFSRNRVAWRRRTDSDPPVPNEESEPQFKYLAYWSTSGTSLDMQYSRERRTLQLEFDGPDRMRLDSDGYTRTSN